MADLFSYLPRPRFRRPRIASASTLTTRFGYILIVGCGCDRTGTVRVNEEASAGSESFEVFGGDSGRGVLRIRARSGQRNIRSQTSNQRS
ncbi:hypothetical protein BpHYR1_047731 [Brachionus plicatilis]|uniref:Uncharacterized protein n=1 Tax=Brachionus plicatilis TaxID=10195 RepID=A0A3M7P0E4_BRAPC|nr:hypothetical protein BpHYR1_047731 [Brachionus plicatilis]